MLSDKAESIKSDGTDTYKYIASSTGRTTVPQQSTYEESAPTAVPQAGSGQEASRAVV